MTLITRWKANYDQAARDIVNETRDFILPKYHNLMSAKFLYLSKIT